MPAFVATVGYVRSLNIGSLSVWCEASGLAATGATTAPT
jgi:hypothetical protein